MKHVPWTLLIVGAYTSLFALRFHDLSGVVTWAVGIVIGLFVREIESMLRYALHHHRNDWRVLVRHTGYAAEQRVSTTPLFSIAALCTTLYIVSSTTHSLAHGVMFGLNARMMQDITSAWRSRRLAEVAFLQMFRHTSTQQQAILGVFMIAWICLHMLYFL